MSPATMRRWTAVVFLLALFLRLGAVFALQRWDDSAPGVNRQLATSLLDHGAFYFRDWGYIGPSSVATPPYPMILAGLYAAFGVDSPAAYFAALSINAVVGGVVAVMAMALVRRAVNHVPASVACGLIVAVWPAQIFAATYSQPVVIVGAAALAACLLWLRAQQRHDLLTWLAFSIAAALAALIQPTLIPALALTVVATLLMRSWTWDLRLRNAAVLLAAAALLLWPWVSRNHAVHGRFVASTTLWQSIWSGANDYATGSDRLPLTPERRVFARAYAVGDEVFDAAVRPPMMQVDLLTPEQRSLLRGQAEIAREALFKQWTGGWMGAHRVQWLRQMWVRLAKAWWIDWDHPMSANPLARWPRAAAALLAGLGIIVVLARCAPLGGVLLILGTHLAVSGVSIATARRTIELEPLQLVLAFAAIGCLLTRHAAMDVIPNGTPEGSRGLATPTAIGRRTDAQTLLVPSRVRFGMTWHLRSGVLR